MEILIVTISLLPAAGLGFAIHHASLCTVNAVAQFADTGNAHPAATMLKTMLWVMVVAVPVSALFPDFAMPNNGYRISAASTIGGFLFGVGAAVNGGCAFSTLWHLANGNLRMLATLLGYCLGVAGMCMRMPFLQHGPASMPVIYRAPDPLIRIAAIVLWFLLCRDVLLSQKTRKRGDKRRDIPSSGHRHHSLHAFVLGSSGGVLYALHDTWTYTDALKRSIQSFWFPVASPDMVSLLLFLALFAGMLLSAWQRGSWRLQWHRPVEWPRHLLGGAMMGAGAVLIPGGNDTLMLKSLPCLSPHAIPTMVALLVGVGVTLPLMRPFTGIAPECVRADVRRQPED